MWWYYGVTTIDGKAGLSPRERAAAVAFDKVRKFFQRIFGSLSQFFFWKPWVVGGIEVGQEMTHDKKIMYCTMLCCACH